MTILVTAPFGSEARAEIKRAAKGETLYFACELSDMDTAKILKNADVIIGNPSIDELKKAKNLKLLQSTNAGVERYTGSQEFPKAITLCNASGAFGVIISEYIIAGILSLYRRFREYDRQQNDCVWRDVGCEQTLEGKTAVILGTGDIGRNTAKRLRAFDVYTIGIRRRPVPEEYFDEVFTIKELDACLSRADIVIGCLPKTAATEGGLLDWRRIGLMKPECVFVNVGRGSLVDTEALARALRDNRLLGAVLDVTEPEPLPKEHSLWGLDNVLLTPHISGMSFGHTPQTETRVAQICCDNLTAYLEGRKLKNVVDTDRGF